MFHMARFVLNSLECQFFGETMSTTHLHAKNYYNHKMSAKELIFSAEELSHKGKDEEALGLYKHWLMEASNASSKCAVLFNYSWLLQKLNRLDEALHVQASLVDAYSSYLSEGSTGSVH
jgi:hypothetical protein